MGTRYVNNKDKAMKYLHAPAGLLAVALFFAITPLSDTAWADNHASPPPMFVLESFGCSYRDGKDEDDLSAVRDAYVKAADKAGISKPRSIVWNRFKGGSRQTVCTSSVTTVAYPTSIQHTML